MRNDPKKWRSEKTPSASVTLVFVSIAILAITVAGVLVTDLYSTFTGSADDQFAADFDPDRLPAPAAGIPVEPKFALNCKEVIYSTTKGGIKYVRVAGGGVFIGAEYQNKFGFYQMEYGLLAPVDEAQVDRFTRAKLEYALYNCEGPFLRTGADF